MKLYLLSALLCSLLFSTANHKVPRVYAMVVGVSKYADTNIPALRFADKDALLFADFLKSANAGAVPEENLVVLTNERATRPNILRELSQLLSRSGPEDLVIFYFAGHGKNDVFENAGYLLTYDTENENEVGTAITMDDIKNKIDRCKAKMKVSYVDACHAGMFKNAGARGTSNDNTEIIKAYTAGLSSAGDGNAAVLACSARQQSLEDEKLGHGVFTWWLIQGLKGEADKEQKDAAGSYNDGVVTIGEMNTYLTRKIEQATKYKQRPTIEGVYDESFPLSIVTANLSLQAEIAKSGVRGTTPAVTAKESGNTSSHKNPNSNPAETGVPKIIEYVTSKENKSLNEGSFAHAGTFARVKFINELKYPIELYYGGSAESGSSLIDALSIAPNSTGTTNPLFVGYADYGKMPVDRSYVFYFYAKDETGRFVFGKLALSLEAMHIYTMRLTRDNFSLTPEGDKDKNALRRLGFTIN